MKAWIACASALSLSIGSGTALAQTPGQVDIFTPDTDPATAADFSAYLGRPEAMRCLDMGSQANARAVLRTDPKDPLQLDRDRNGIAGDANVEPRDTNPVPR